MFTDRMVRAWRARAQSGKPDHLKNPTSTARPPAVVQEGRKPIAVKCALDEALTEQRRNDRLGGLDV